MAQKKSGTSGRPKKKTAPAESPAAKGLAITKSVLPGDHVILVLMVGGVILGFFLYLFFLKVAPLLLPLAITVEDVQFLREEGEIRFTILNNEDTSNACQAAVLLFLDGTQVFQKSIDAGVLEPGSRRTVSIEADIPEGEFDYDIKVSCNPGAQE